MHRVLAVLLACLSASNSLADQIQYFPLKPTTSQAVDFSVDCRTAKEANYSWSVKEPGTSEFKGGQPPSPALKTTLGTVGNGSSR